MGGAINELGHEKNVAAVLNAMGKRSLKVKIELIGKLGSNNTKNIGMLPSASKDVSVKFEDQCLYILNNNKGLNGIKGITKMHNRSLLFKSQSRIYNFQRNSDVNHRGMKMR